jgi:hypothetical protein
MVYLTFTSKFSMETHMLEFVLKTVVQHHRDRTDPLLVRQEFINLQGLESTY